MRLPGKSFLFVLLFKLGKFVVFVDFSLADWPTNSHNMSLPKCVGTESFKEVSACSYRTDM